MVNVNARLGKGAHMCIIHCFTFSLCRMLGAGLLFIVKLLSLLCGFIIHDETCTSESHDIVEYFARVLQSNDRFTDLHDKKSLLKDKVHELL